MRVIVTLFLGLATSNGLVVAPAHADEPTASPAKPVKTLICRVEPSTGSILPHRTCLTAEEWKEARRRNEDNADAARASGRRMDPAVTMGGGGTPYDISGGPGAFH